MTFSFGFSSGWATINLPDLQNENSAFPFSLTKDEASLLVAFQYLGSNIWVYYLRLFTQFPLQRRCDDIDLKLFLGSILGNYLTLPISQVLGAKRTIHLFGVPILISPFLIFWAQNVIYLYVSRILVGMTFGA